MPNPTLGLLEQLWNGCALVWGIACVGGVLQSLKILFWRVDQDYIDIWIYSCPSAVELCCDLSLKFSRVLSIALTNLALNIPFKHYYFFLRLVNLIRQLHKSRGFFVCSPQLFKIFLHIYCVFPFFSSPEWNFLVSPVH